MIEGLAVFRPSGKLLRIDADAIAAAGAGDSYFSTIPLPGVADYAAAVRTRPGASPYKELLGMIPGEETDEEFFIAMEALNLNTGMRTTKYTKRHETRETCDCLPVHLMDECINIHNCLIS